MTAFGGLLRVLALVAVVCATAGAEIAIPPAPTQWVTDTAGFLTPQTIADQNARLGAYEKQTGHQVLVYVAPTTAETPTEDWTVRAFAAWKVGRKNLDDGVALFVFPRDRTVRIEVGYGLESVLPDITASRIIREAIVPQMRAGRPDAAVVAGLDRILAAVGGASGAKQNQSGDAQTQNGSASDTGTPLSPLTLVLIGLGILAFIVIAIKSPSTALLLLFTVMGRGGGGGSMGGGGFSGGGGRSGGGGASGRW